MGRYEETGADIILFCITLIIWATLALFQSEALDIKRDGIKNNIRLEIIITEEGEVECTNIETD